jgi:hypothetical protein
MRDETKTKQRVSRTTLRHIKVKRLKWYKIENGGTKSTPLNLPLFVWYHLFSDHKSLLVYVESCDWIGCPSPQFCKGSCICPFDWLKRESFKFLFTPSKIEEMEKMENYLFLAQSKIFLLLFYEKKKKKHNHVSLKIKK